MRAPSIPLNRIIIVIFAVLLSVVPLFVLRGLSWPSSFRQAQIRDDYARTGNDDAWTKNDEARGGNDSTGSTGQGWPHLAASDVGRILVLYQITAEGIWQDVIRDQVTKLIFSGLYDDLSLVHCAVFGASPNATSDASTYLSGFGSKFTVVGLPGAPAISRSIASMDTLTATDRVLFLATYGAAELENSEAAYAAYVWRTLMEYKLIKDYQHCLQLLHQTDVVGIDLTNAGNSNASFWWASGQRLLSYSAKDSDGLVGTHSVFKKGGRPPSLDLFPRTGVGHSSTHGSRTHADIYAISPASYVDDVEPFVNPCRGDSGSETNTSETNCKVYVFHHLYVDNAWKDILVDQLVKLIFSGVYDRAAVIYSTISGRDPGAIAAAAHLINSFGRKFNVLHQHLNNGQYERATLYEIKQHISEEDIVYYFHLKGVSGGFRDSVSRQDPDTSRRIWHWRNVMEYFLMRHHKTCISLLDPSEQVQGMYDVVGINRKTCCPTHFSGNFWWTTGRHWLKLPDVIGEAYNDPENFLLSGGASPRTATLWCSGIEHYQNDYYPREYSDIGSAPNVTDQVIF